MSNSCANTASTDVPVGGAAQSARCSLVFFIPPDCTTGIKLANPALKVIVESGDGCMYGEGGNHFLSAIRRNINVTALVHDNQIYALTKGQASPTSQEGFVTKAQPHGVQASAFNPVAVALLGMATHPARALTPVAPPWTVEYSDATLHPFT